MILYIILVVCVILYIILVVCVILLIPGCMRDFVNSWLYVLLRGPTSTICGIFLSTQWQDGGSLLCRCAVVHS